MIAAAVLSKNVIRRFVSTVKTPAVVLSIMALGSFMTINGSLISMRLVPDVVSISNVAGRSEKVTKDHKTVGETPFASWSFLGDGSQLDLSRSAAGKG